MSLRSARFVFAILGVLILAALWSHQANAWGRFKDVTITKDDQTATLDCDGSVVTVRGKDNKLTINGECKKVAVSGDDNTITIKATKDLEISGNDNNITVDAVDKIVVPGDDNNIIWKTGARGTAPLISSKGNGNKIKHAS